MHALGEQIAPVRRRRDVREDPARGRAHDAPVARVDERDARRSVVREQRLVVRVGEHVLVRDDLSGGAGRLLHGGPACDGGRGRRPHAIDRAHGEVRAVGQPAHRVAKDVVDGQVRDARRARGGGRADPQLRAVRRRVGQGEPRSVRREAQRGEVRAGGQGDGRDVAVGDALERKRRHRRGVMDAVRHRVDAQARQPQHRPREVGHGRITQRRLDRDDGTARRDHHDRDRRRFQHGLDRRHRCAVAGCVGECRRRKGTAEGGGEDETARKHARPVRYGGGASYAGERAR